MCPACGAGLLAKGFKRRTVIDVVPPGRRSSFTNWSSATAPGVTGCSALRHPGCLPKDCWATGSWPMWPRNIMFRHHDGPFGAAIGTAPRQLTGGHARPGRPAGISPGQAGSGVPSGPPVKHADETGWRNDGRNGYAWLFCTPRLSLFRFRQSRSAKVALELFGKKRLPGTLVIDRYAAYNKILCSKQYCLCPPVAGSSGFGRKEFAEPVQEVPRFCGDVLCSLRCWRKP